jgi:hypothetical protein
MKRRFTLKTLFIVATIIGIGFNLTAQNGNRTTKDTRNFSQEYFETDPNNVGIAPNLGSAADFAVLGASTVTNTGLSILVGNLGVSPGTAITGFPPGTVLGTTYTGDPGPAADAQADALLSYNSLAAQVCETDLTGEDLGGQTLLPGVYCFPATSAQLTGILTLDGDGDPNAVFIFKIGSTLTTASVSSVVMINEAKACNTFFQVGSSATLGTSTEFQGNIIADASITLNTEANVFGRAIALNGAVTLDTNDVTRCNLAPTSAGVNLGGRVMTADGHGIAFALITLTDARGNVRTVYTGTFGNYNFDNVAAGQTVLLTVSQNRYYFPTPTLVISVNDELTTANFIAN